MSELPEPQEWSLAACFHLLLTILGWQVLTVIALFVVGSAVRVLVPAGLVERWGGPLVFVALELVWLYVLRRYRGCGGVKPLWQEEELRDGRFWMVLAGAIAVCIGANLARLWLSEGTVRLNPAGLTAGPGPVQWGPSLAVIAAAVGLAPIAEEWFFRGILQGVLSRRWGPWVSIPATALVFGALHGLTDMWVVATYGLVFGLLAHRRHSLTLPILAHAAVNLIALGVPLGATLANR